MSRPRMMGWPHPAVPVEIRAPVEIAVPDMLPEFEATAGRVRSYVYEQFYGTPIDVRDTISLPKPTDKSIAKFVMDTYKSRTLFIIKRSDTHKDLICRIAEEIMESYSDMTRFVIIGAHEMEHLWYSRYGITGYAFKNFDQLKKNRRVIKYEQL